MGISLNVFPCFPVPLHTPQPLVCLGSDFHAHLTSIFLSEISGETSPLQSVRISFIISCGHLTMYFFLRSHPPLLPVTDSQNPPPFIPHHVVPEYDWFGGETD